MFTYTCIYNPFCRYTGLQGVCCGAFIRYTGLFCGSTGLFCGSTGLFCGSTGLFCGSTGLSCRYTGLFCSEFTPFLSLSTFFIGVTSMMPIYSKTGHVKSCLFVTLCNMTTKKKSHVHDAIYSRICKVTNLCENILFFIFFLKKIWIYAHTKEPSICDV